MMTFKDLKKLVELPSYKEQRVPTVKALEVSGVPVVTEKVLENHGSINVYQNGYVIYRAHKRVTVFSLRDCVHYKYDAAEGAGYHIEEAEFDDYEWHIRLVLEGEDRIFMNYEIIQGKWMPSREDREYSETDLIYSAQSGENISGEMREDERYRFYFQDKLEIPILEKNFPHDREILMEILELLVETVTSRKKFLRICGEEKPKEVVKSRLMKLDSMHIQYVMECLKSNTTQVRNIKQYLLATLYNAPTTIDSYYAAQVRHDFGWGGRSN